MTYISLTKAEHSVVDAISATKHEMLSIVKDWSSINSGSYNHSGLKDMRERLSDSFSSLPGEISELTLEEGQQIDQKGNISEPMVAQPLIHTKTRKCGHGKFNIAQNFKNFENAKK